MGKKIPTNKIPYNISKIKLSSIIPPTIPFQYIEKYKFNNIRLLADLFHMNIEEDNMNESIHKTIQHIGHVHFADSNRKPVGCGHAQMKEITDALITSGYDGYVSAEAFPWPDPEQAALQTIRSFHQYFK